MGTLKPGATYIYEHADGITYAREFGAPHNQRFEIGRTLERQSLTDSIKEDKLWGDIRRAARSNQVLQDALDRVKIIYELRKNDGD
jgi:heme oxygenase